MNIDELVSLVRAHKNKYKESTIDEFITKLREGPPGGSKWNMIRFRPNGLDLIQSPNPEEYIEENHIYIHPQTNIRYYIEMEDFLVFE